VFASDSNATQPSVPRGLAVGVCVGLVGGAVWVLVERLTGYQIGFVAVGIGYGVGRTVAQIGKTRQTSAASAAAGIAFCAAVLGHVASVYAALAATFDVGVGTILRAIDVGTVLRSTTGFTWALCGFAAFAAFRAFAAAAAELPQASTVTATPPPAWSAAEVANDTSRQKADDWPYVPMTIPPHILAARRSRGSGE
jgi:hypothetical protein